MQSGTAKRNYNVEVAFCGFWCSWSSSSKTTSACNTTTKPKYHEIQRFAAPIFFSVAFFCTGGAAVCAENAQVSLCCLGMSLQPRSGKRTPKPKTPNTPTKTSKTKPKTARPRETHARQRKSETFKKLNGFGCQSLQKMQVSPGDSFKRSQR